MNKIVVENVSKVFGPNAQSMIPLIEQGVSKQDILEQHGHVVGIRKLNLEIAAGETFVVMGLSGSGKSTLVRLLNRLIEPTLGQVLIDGEDVTNVDKRPTAESIESYLSVTLKYLSFDAQNSLQNHSVSFITDGNRLFSFTESGESNWIRPVIKRLENKQNSIRNKSSYYLLYALMDVLIDQYFVVLEQLNDRVDALDTDITQNVSHEQLDQLYKLKKEFLLFRKQNTIIPGVVRSIEDELDENSWESVAIFFQDLLSHTIDIQESTKSNLEGLSSMFDLYFSLLSL